MPFYSFLIEYISFLFHEKKKENFFFFRRDFWTNSSAIAARLHIHTNNYSSVLILSSSHTRVKAKRTSKQAVHRTNRLFLLFFLRPVFFFFPFLHRCTRNTLIETRHLYKQCRPQEVLHAVAHLQTTACFPSAQLPFPPSSVPPMCLPPPPRCSAAFATRVSFRLLLRCRHRPQRRAQPPAPPPHASRPPSRP